MKTVNMMIVGVGGQGSLLASKVLGHLLLTQGYDVKVCEVHGMSQRGGSVVTYVRFGDKVYAPIVDEGEADYIVSFEKLEAARWLSHLKKGGRIVTNTQEIEPMPVITGAAAYPDHLIEKMQEKGVQVDALDCLSLAEQAKGRRFISVEEVSAACPKVSKTHIDKLTEAGAFGDMPATSQLDLFAMLG